MKLVTGGPENSPSLRRIQKLPFSLFVSLLQAAVQPSESAALMSSADMSSVDEPSVLIVLLMFLRPCATRMNLGISHIKSAL